VGRHATFDRAALISSAWRRLGNPALRCRYRLCRSYAMPSIALCFSSPRRGWTSRSDLHDRGHWRQPVPRPEQRLVPEPDVCGDGHWPMLSALIGVSGRHTLSRSSPRRSSSRRFNFLRVVGGTVVSLRWGGQSLTAKRTLEEGQLRCQPSEVPPRSPPSGQHAFGPRSRTGAVSPAPLLHTRTPLVRKTALNLFFIYQDLPGFR